jgi:hypothetical protein
MMKNSGVEILITANPVRGDFNWDIGLNLAKNSNEVVSLIEGLDELSLEEPRTRTVRIKHIVGQPFGTITGIVQKISPSGQPVFDADGRPTASDGYEIIGQGVSDWTGGINNALSYKNFYFDFLIDFKFGGDIYAGTEARLTQAGLTQRTLQGREGEAPLSVSGVTQTGTDASGNPVYESFSKTLTVEEAQSYWGSLTDRNSLPFMYDASFIKLRQVSLGFNFPESIIAATPFDNLALSFVGRNLAIIHKDTDNIDPEASYTNSNSQGLDYFGALPVRSFGFNLRATF